MNSMHTKHQKRSKSNQRLLMERLQRAKLKPRAWMVALVLEAYARIERGTGKRISSLYHQKIAGITGMSVENVRRALRELTKGGHPLYRRRNATGAQHTIYGNNDFELTTTGAIYEWIDCAAGSGLPVPPNTIADASATTRGRKVDPRCLTAAQVEQFSYDMYDDPAYGDLVVDGTERIAEYHALRRHVIDKGCKRCQVAVAQTIAGRMPEQFSGVKVDEFCGCGEHIVRADDRTFEFWDFARGDLQYEHQCHVAAGPDIPRQGSQA